MDLDKQIKGTERILNMGEYTVAAKECVGLIEQALRQLFSQHLTSLEERDRLKVNEAERQIGKGERGIENFTMGQLVGVFRMSKFIDAWARASGKDVSSLRVINLDQLTELRNTFIHGRREATRFEAELLLNCLHVIVDVFGISKVSTRIITELSSEGEAIEHLSPPETRSPSRAAAMLLKAQRPTDEREDVVAIITYALQDDLPVQGGTKGWVTVLLHRLQELLQQKLNAEEEFSLWIEAQQLEPSRFSPGMFPTAIPLVVLSPAYIASEWCDARNSAFLSFVQQRTQAGRRAFVLECESLRSEEMPPQFTDVTDYQSWLTPRHTEDATRLMPDEPRDMLRYNNLLTELSLNMADEFLELQRRNTVTRDLQQDIPQPGDVGQVIIFLADVTDDLYAVREDLERALLKAGATILPEDPDDYPRSASAFQEMVRSDIAQSDLVVQLLGPLAGRRPKHLPQGYVRCQYEIAQELGKPVLQWRDPEVDPDAIDDAEHCELLQGSTVRTTALETFQHEILKHLRQEAESKPAPVADIGLLLYLDADTGEDALLIDEICHVFDQLGVGYAKPLKNGTPAEIRKTFEDYVLACDALIIVYGKASLSWINSQHIAIRRIFAHRRNWQPPTFAIFEGPPPQKESVNFRIPNMHIIKCHDYIDEQKIRRFIESLPPKGDAVS